ncbi:MAG TPA: hypothetical protein VGY48_34240, partial [Vicinamibacterales bacterium]|nr:hypothetical protein [Vicinamibacterales bacterium]
RHRRLCGQPGQRHGRDRRSMGRGYCVQLGQCVQTARVEVLARAGSSRTVDQLADLLPMAGIQLTAAELARLGAV